MKKIITSCVILTLSACASNPDKMVTAYISPIKYESYTCRQIASEQETISGRTVDLYNRLKKERSADNWQMGVGLLVLWPTLFFLEGGDGVEASEYSRLKGEYEALRQANLQKSCDLNFMASTDELIKMEDERLKKAEDDAEETQKVAEKKVKAADRAERDASRATSKAADAAVDATEASDKAKLAVAEATKKGTSRAENRAENAQEDADKKLSEAEEMESEAKEADRLAKEARREADEAVNAAAEAQEKLE